MVSEAYREIENSVGLALMINEDLLQGISYKLGAEKSVIQNAIYQVSVVCGHPSLTIAHIVNEFLSAHREQGREKDGDEA